MIIYLLKKFFKIIIGDLPKEQQIELRRRFNVLMSDVAKAAAEGAVKGLTQKNP